MRGRRFGTAGFIVFAICGAVASASTVTDSISANFNGTAIANGNYIWFTSVLAPTFPTGNATVQFYLTNASIAFTANSVNYSIAVPNAIITFDPSLNANTSGSATVSFDTVNNTWDITAPKSGLSGNTLLDAVAYQVTTTGGLPGGIKNVTWTANFSTNTSGATLNWKWAAAVYNPYTDSYNSLNVKPVDDNGASLYLNSDHAGTPEQVTPNYKADLMGGATGGTGSNYTGSYSGTSSVAPPVGTPPPSAAPNPSTFYGGALLLGCVFWNYSRRRRGRA